MMNSRTDSPSHSSLPGTSDKDGQLAQAEHTRRVPPPQPGTRYGGRLAVSVLLAIISWGTLYYLLNNVYPTPLNEIAFLILWGIALLGSTWPALLAINQRLVRYPPPARIWRQSSWVALFGLFVAWLQINRALSLPLAITLAGALGLVETLLVLREREQARHAETHSRSQDP